MMDADLKTKWLAALRSGYYAQARGQLRKGEAYCCLGVLCRVAGLYVRDSASSMFAPTRFLSHEDQSELANRNDGITHVVDHPFSFAELADYIERNIPVTSQPSSAAR